MFKTKNYSWYITHVKSWMVRYGVYKSVFYTYVTRYRTTWTRTYNRYVDQRLKSGKFYLVSASYGYGRRQKNVKSIVNALYKRGTRDFIATNSAFGDPYRGKVKYLRITFFRYGRMHRLTVREHSGDKISVKAGRIVHKPKPKKVVRKKFKVPREVRTL